MKQTAITHKHREPRNGEPKLITETLGVHFSKKGVAEYWEIRGEADKIGMKPSDYARRLIRLGREVAKADPLKVMYAVFED